VKPHRHLPALGVVAAVALASACSGTGHHAAASTAPTSTSTTTVPLAAPVRCPPILPDRIANAGVPGLADQMVPGTATRLDVCRYGPLTGAGPLSVKSRFTLVERATVTDFQAATDALAVRPPGAIFNCPNDDGEALVLIFSESARSVTVRVSLSGCAFVTNGVRTGLSSAQWHSRLTRIEVADCPSSPPAFAQPARQYDPLGRTLVPIVATSIRVCRYTTPTASQNTLNSTKLSTFGVLDDATQVGALESRANGLRRLDPAERVPCPLAINAPSWFITFANQTSSVDLVETPGNCGYLYNGVLTAIPTQAWHDAVAHIAVLR
jgi:hypothetical protein